jgi:3-(3-hydroxy-phenyl)propionate hydroxylase
MSQSAMSQGEMWDVAIVGCGPVGATAANLLGQAGHKVLIVDQYRDVFTLPRAVHLDHEMMRIFQSLQLIDSILPIIRETQGHLHLGADGDVIRYMASVGKAKRFGWANDYFFYQPELEAALRAGFKRFANVEFRQGAVFEQVTNQPDCCELKVGGETLRARYVLGCDGAHSAVRNSVGIDLDDLRFQESWLVVDANVNGPISFPPIPSLPAGADPQQLSVMCCDPRRPATIVPGRGSHRRWEFMLLPGESETEIVKESSIKALIEPWLQGCTYEIVRAATYRFQARVAQEWRKQRVFVAGDAAHLTPPFFGQGMCHGLRDASNLSFKLDLVLRGLAADSLLDTYQQEREPQVRHVIGAAVAAGRYICELDPAKAVERDATLRRLQREGKDISTAADLIAPYMTGLVRNGGERFVQPMLRYQGCDLLLDDVTGPGFVILSNQPIAAHPVISKLGMQQWVFDEVMDANGDLAAVFKAHQATAVVLRPDHYVYGWATSTLSLTAILESLDQQLLPAARTQTQTAMRGVSHV